MKCLVSKQSQNTEFLQDSCIKGKKYIYNLKISYQQHWIQSRRENKHNASIAFSGAECNSVCKTFFPGIYLKLNESSQIHRFKYISYGHFDSSSTNQFFFLKKENISSMQLWTISPATISKLRTKVQILASLEHAHPREYSMRNAKNIRGLGPLGTKCSWCVSQQPAHTFIFNSAHKLCGTSLWMSYT